ncbi:amidohydrolase family protein [Sphingoaurantiacus capsulatus]|uniref:Amidohydrolase family protein n=1 Tax=Sphingoaurantiacus capsulatus TaxID=1771310 RepID=A0ABV7X595_9SPHN
MKRLGLTIMAALLAATATPAAAQSYDLLIRNGLIHDGAGGTPYLGEVGIKGDRIAYVGAKAPGRAKTTVDAGGKAVAPGFINMLSHSRETLLNDGRGMSGILQGVTLEVNSESSLAPLTDRMRQIRESRQGDIKVPITWSTLGGYFDALEKSGISPNVASFIAAGSIREYVLGTNDVDPTPEQLNRMRALVRDAMNDGAMGVATMLIYIPEMYADTSELVALATEAGKCGGLYAAHIRDEQDHFLGALEETVAIARQAKVPVHVHHLKQSNPENWYKLDPAIAVFEGAQKEGLRMTADMYTYPASGTGANSMLPAWVQEGGLEATIERLKDPAARARAAAELELPGGDPKNVLFSGFKTEKLKPYAGKRLDEVAKARGTSPADTVIDLIVEDGSRVNTIFFRMSEDNVRRQTTLPWMTFGADAGVVAAEGVVLKSSNHPRAYGNFARLLAKYVREEKTIPLQEAVRKLTTAPAAILGLKDRGALKPGAYADVVIFDPATVQDHATFAQPHQYSTGVSEVWVNGVQVVKAGAHTGAKPGRAVRGRGC